MIRQKRSLFVQLLITSHRKKEMPENKLVKRLKKLWPPKKKKELFLRWNDQHHRGYVDLLPPPSPHCHCSCSNSPPPAHPSGPPLPSWLNPDQTGYVIPGLADSGSGVAGSHYVTSYRQYRVLEPVRRVPSAAARRGRSGGGFFRCLAKFWINVIRCFCPCFHVREVH